MPGTGLTEKQERALKGEGGKPAKEPKERPVRAARSKDPRDCECGCGEQTKGGRFRPGHDARLHAREKAEAAAKAASSPVEGQQTVDGGEI